MSIPTSHPNVHDHKGKTCPVTKESHDWCAPQPTDSRSPCPALNAMANHGYIHRDGKNIGAFDLIRALKECYNLSTPLAIVLAFGGYILIKTFRRVSLYEFGTHGEIEHDASLVHENTPAGEKFAPIEVHPELLEQLVEDVKKGKGDGRVLVNAEDVARVRIRREKTSNPLDPLHAEIARGEMAILLGAWEVSAGEKKGIPLEWFAEWIKDERIPKDAKSTHVQGLLNTVGRSKEIRVAMKKMREAEANANSGNVSTSGKTKDE